MLQLTHYPTHVHLMHLHTGVVGSWWFIPAASGHKSVVSGNTRVRVHSLQPPFSGAEKREKENGSQGSTPRHNSCSLRTPNETGSFGRAATTSLGSICFGALIVAVLEAMKVRTSAWIGM